MQGGKGSESVPLKGFRRNYGGLNLCFGPEPQGKGKGRLLQDNPCTPLEGVGREKSCFGTKIFRKKRLNPNDERGEHFFRGKPNKRTGGPEG